MIDLFQSCVSWPSTVSDPVQPTLPFIWFAANKELVTKAPVLVSSVKFICADHQSPLKNGRYILADNAGFSWAAGIHFNVP